LKTCFKFFIFSSAHLLNTSSAYIVYFRMGDPWNNFALVKVAKWQMRIALFTLDYCSTNTKWWITHLSKESGSLGDSQPPPPSKVPPREFQIVIYLAGSSETAVRPGLAYANRYFIPVCGNKNRGWGIRWFSRGKFNAEHSDSMVWCVSCFVFSFSSFFFFLFLARASCDRKRPSRDALSFDLSYFPRWFLQIHIAINPTAEKDDM